MNEIIEFSSFIIFLIAIKIQPNLKLINCNPMYIIGENGEPNYRKGTITMLATLNKERIDKKRHKEWLVVAAFISIYKLGFVLLLLLLLFWSFFPFHGLLEIETKKPFVKEVTKRVDNVEGKWKGLN